MLYKNASRKRCVRKCKRNMSFVRRICGGGMEMNMSELFVKMRRGSVFTSILCIVIGVLFCVWPGNMLIILCRVVGAVLLIAGIVLLIMAWKTQDTLGRSVRILPGIVCLVLGIWILARPGAFLVLIPVLIGILLVYHGVKDLMFCLEVKKGPDTRWWFGLIFAVLTLALGFLLIFRAWRALEIGMIFVGIVLIYDGICGLWLNRKAAKAAGTFGGAQDDVIDVDYKEE